MAYAKTYELRVIEPFTDESRQFSSAGKVKATACTDCGALVVDTDAHDRFHSEPAPQS